VSKYKRLGKNTILVFIGNLGSKLIALFMLPFYTKWLSVEDYGVTDVITVYAGFFLGIISLSIAEAVFIYPKDKDIIRQKKYFSSGLFFSFVCFLVAAFIFFIAKSIFRYYHVVNSFTQYTWTIYFVILAMFLQVYLQQFTRCIDKMKIYAITGIILTTLIALFAFLLIPSFGVMGFVYAQILAYLTASLFTFFGSKSYTYISFKAIKLPYYKEMIFYSVPLIPNGIMWWLISSLNRPIMESSIGVYGIGIFAVANKFPSMVAMVFTVFANSWQISVLEEFNKKSFEQYYNKILQVIFSLLVLLSCGVAIFSKQIVTFFADEKFYEAWKLVPVLTLAILFSSLSGFVGTCFSAARKSKYYFYSSIWGALASVLLNLLLIPYFGLFGAVFAVVLSHFVMAISRIKYSWQYVKITNFHLYGFMVLLNLLVIFITLLVDNPLIKYSSYILLFITLFMINKGIKPDFLVIMKKIVNKLKS
jgi:O-antigen/teichoic acid export membrane protein